jgi:hypothetical protein
VIKTIKTLLPREMGIPQQALATCDLAVVDLPLTQGIEELARAPSFRLSLLGERLPVAAKRASFNCMSSSGKAAGTACERGSGEEVVIGGQQVLRDIGISHGGAARRHPEALLQERETGTGAAGLAAERRARAQTRPPARPHKAPWARRAGHQSGAPDRCTRPSALGCRCHRCGAAGRPSRCPLIDQPVMVQPHRDLAANQVRRHRVDDLPHLDRAGAPRPHREQLVVGKAKGGQWCQPFEFLLMAPLARSIEGAEHLG